MHVKYVKYSRILHIENVKTNVFKLIHTNKSAELLAYFENFLNDFELEN